MEKKLEKPYPTNVSLLIAQDLCQDHYQILIVILLKEINGIKLKHGHNDKKCEICEIKYKNCFYVYINFKDDLIGHKCLCYNKNYQKRSLLKI